jgi:hypothetical protein
MHIELSKRLLRRDSKDGPIVYVMATYTADAPGRAVELTVNGNQTAYYAEEVG